jgi:hypothetical protein
VSGLEVIQETPNVKQLRKEFAQVGTIDRVKVQCFPLYAILMAMGNPEVDYFSLDVEGAELG